MPPQDGPYFPTNLHNLFTNMAQDILNKNSSKLLLGSAPASKVVLGHSVTKVLEEDCLLKLLNRGDVIAAATGSGPLETQVLDKSRYCIYFVSKVISRRLADQKKIIDSD